MISSFLFTPVQRRNTLRRSWRSLTLRRNSSGTSPSELLLIFYLFFSALLQVAIELLLIFFSFLFFRHRLYQDDCACVLGHYIKDLSILGRDLTKTVVLDNAPHTYPYHVRNFTTQKTVLLKNVFNYQSRTAQYG